jgi:thiamine pyrophosphokinase
MSGNCYITGAGTHYEHDIFFPSENDIVIAADGGYRFNNTHNIKTDIIIGDFDSMPVPEIQDEILIKLDPVKDETDMLCAIKAGIARKYKNFHIFGGTGGRTDHTIANIQCLSYLARNGMMGYIYTENEVLTAIHNSSICFEASMKGYISVFSLDEESRGITETGLRYEIENYTIKNNFPIGVSNEFTGIKSTVSVSDGTLLIIYPRLF